MIERRAFCLAVGSLALAGRAFSQTAPAGPLLWSAQRIGRLYVFGFAEARDRSWLTPAVAGAFAQSDSVWFETPPQPVGPPDPAIMAAMLELGTRPGRTFYDPLEPDVRERARAWVAELGIAPEAIEPLRPWFAYYTINGAYWAQNPRPYATDNPEQALREMADAAGKRVLHEYATPAEAFGFFAGMSDAVESQYIEMLLGYLDDEKAGRNEDAFGWAAGVPGHRALDRMRAETPDLYRVIQVERNAWWAAKIEELIADDGTHFIAVGMNHVLGPDGIPAQLERRGVPVALLTA